MNAIIVPIPAHEEAASCLKTCGSITTWTAASLTGLTNVNPVCRVRRDKVPAPAGFRPPHGGTLGKSRAAETKSNLRKHLFQGGFECGSNQRPHMVRSLRPWFLWNCCWENHFNSLIRTLRYHTGLPSSWKPMYPSGGLSFIAEVLRSMSTICSPLRTTVSWLSLTVMV